MLPTPPTLRLRKLHRQHSRRRSRIVVMNTQDLAAAIQCRPENVEDELVRRSLPYHKDSSGEIWASMPLGKPL